LKRCIRTVTLTAVSLINLFPPPCLLHKIKQHGTLL
jgi:hypothetical protein